MTRDEVEKALEKVFEELAALEHERWAHWQKYIHDKGQYEPDGSLRLPAELVTRWEAQISKPYSALTEHEKDSDREQVRRYLPMIMNALVDELRS